MEDSEDYRKGYLAGIRFACSTVDEMYGRSNTHPKMQGDCVLAKLNMLNVSLVRDNPSFTDKTRSIQPPWCRKLTMRQQSVLFLAGRGGDGLPKHHPTKGVQRAYRGTILLAAKYGRLLEWGEVAGSFMSLDRFGNDQDWAVEITKFFDYVDEVPHHFYMHLMHGAEIIGYKHPDQRFRERWNEFYKKCVYDLHLTVETEEEMDIRLSDWNKVFWGGL
jgi:hypothetical protein